jgi:flagellar M-ring protein FliF
MAQQIAPPQADQGSEEQPKGGIGSMFRDAPLPYKLAYMATAALLVGGLVALMLWVNRPEYQVLYSGLNQQDASAVVSKLQEMKVPYKLEGGGAVITVSNEQVYDVRLAMAGAGLPRGAGVGFEVFNEVKMGTTEFVQKINYQRALQGELARTIAGFSEVDKARVHIVMPRESLFVEEEKKPSAGVVVDLSAGHRLSADQVAGIVHLVASAVPDLTDDRVTIVDTQGNLIYRKAVDNGDFPGALTASQLEYQRNVESALKAKAQSMLEQVLGPGKAVVRVSADIDYTRTSSNQESFDPDGVVVRSETRTTESTAAGNQSPVGSPDQRFALAARNATPPQGGEAGQESKRENETSNFEISRTRTQTVKAIGGLERLSVAVVVDGPYKVGAGADGEATRTFDPRSAQQMRQLEEIVARAVGYNEERGDKISLINTPFYLADEAGMIGIPWWEEYINKYGRMALNLVLALLFFFFVVRPLLRYLMTILPQPTPEPAAELTGALAAGELPSAEELEEEERRRKPTVIEQIAELVKTNPERATSVLRAWIHEED